LKKGYSIQTVKVKIIPGFLAFSLYLLTLVLGLWAIGLIREIYLVIYTQFSLDASLASVIDYLLILIMGLVFVGFAIITAEYHRQHIGQPSSWRLFIQSLAVEIAIPILAFILKQ
jgi:putative copper export protein